jgi:tetratricopeptide (TPR) repeat protein
VQATAHRHLAAAQMGLGLNEDAQAELAAALELYRSLGDQQGEGRIHFQMARICCRRDDYHGAVIHGRQARRLARSCGQPADEAHALNTTGWFHALLGNHRLARAYCERALSMHRQVGSKLGEALTLQVLSVMNMQAGRHQQAITLLRQAMDACRETGFRFYYADMLDDLGDAYHAANDLLAARDSWRLALAIFEELRHPRASQSRGKLITRSPATRSPPR